MMKKTILALAATAALASTLAMQPASDEAHGWRFKKFRVVVVTDSCHWLKQKAKWTGSDYWWDRYYACKYRSGY